MPSRHRSRHRLLILHCLRHRHEVLRLTIRLRVAHQQNMINGYRLAAMTRQMDADAAAFEVERGNLADILLQRARPPTCSASVGTNADCSGPSRLQRASVAVQTEPGAWNALIQEVHCSNARRFRAEAALRAAGLPGIPADYRG